MYMCICKNCKAGAINSKRIIPRSYILIYVCYIHTSYVSTYKYVHLHIHAKILLYQCNRGCKLFVAVCKSLVEILMSD